MLLRPRQFILGVGIGLVIIIGFKAFYEAGVKKGLDNFHNLCYNVGGYVINEQRQVIVCQPLSTIPKEEYDKNFKGDGT